MRRVQGYSGFYNGVYLRSFLEFSYAMYLDSKGIKWSYESEMYDLEGVSYKPDFFLYDKNGSVYKIVEVKGEGNYEAGNKKVQKFKELYGTEIEILTQKELTKLYREEMPIRLHRAKKIWIEEYTAVLKQDVTGKNNPMYGKKQSEITKRKISEKAKNRIEINKVGGKRLVAYNLKNNFAHAKKPRSPREWRVCQLEGCNEKFEVTVYSNRKFCCSEHGSINAFKIATNVYVESRNEELAAINKLVHEWALENKELVLSTQLNRISPTLKNLFDEIEFKYGIKDKRTISKAIFGEDKGRKELVIYLKEYLT